MAVKFYKSENQVPLEMHKVRNDSEAFASASRGPFEEDSGGR